MSKRSRNKKQQQETSKRVNYSLFNQKITFDFLKSHLWAAADILRGSLDPADYRQPIMTLLFIKRLNSVEEWNMAVNLLGKRYNHDKELSLKVADTIWNKIGSKDVRDLLQVGKLSKTIEDVDFVATTLKKYTRGGE